MELDPKNAKLNVTTSTAFRETISMRLNLEESQSFSRTVSVDENNSDEIKTADTIEKNSSKIPLLPRVPSLTQPNVEELLRSLRQKINSLHAEKQFNDPLSHMSSPIHSETGSRRHENFFSASRRGKSDLFPKDTRKTYGEARASFTQRIQDIWIQEKTSSQLAVIHRHGRHVSTDVNSNILEGEHISEEKEIDRYSTNKYMKINGNEYVTKDNITNCNINNKNNKINENEDFDKEKEINPDITDKNAKTDESTDFKKEEEMNRSVIDGSAKIYMNEGSREIKIDSNEDCQKKKTDCIETGASGRGDDEALISSFSSSNDIEIPKPIVCHAAVQYSVPGANVSEKLDRPRVLPSTNNDDKSEIQIELLESIDNYNKITVDSTQFAAAQEIEVLSQLWTEVSTGFATTQPFISIQSKTTEPTAEKLRRFNESTPEKNISHPESAPRNIVNKISRLLVKLPRNKMFRNPLTRLPKIVSAPSLRSKKSYFTKKIRSWLGQKFSSNHRSRSSSRRSKLGCIAIIFKCTEKSSESRLPAIVRPTPPIRRKRRVQNCAGTATEAMVETEQNGETILNENSKAERAEDIGVDSSAIEPESSSSCKMHCERSMTTLSVTTSNSTNIPLELLGSTSDANVVPSHDAQDDFKPRLAEITTRKPEIETCKETDDCRTDLSSTASNIPSAEESKIFEFVDVLDMSNCVEKKFRRVYPARKTSRSKENSVNVIARNKNEDLSSTEGSSKIFDYGEKFNSCASKTKGSLDKKSRRVDPSRKISGSKENSPILRRRWTDAGTDKIIVNKKRSLDIENLPSRKGVQNKIGKISLETKSGNGMRLNCRESKIDISNAKFIERESNRESSEMRDSSDKSANRKSLPDTLKDEPLVGSNEPKNLEKNKQSEVRGLHSAGFYPDLMPAVASKKNRQRADSPIIRNASYSRKRKNSASDGSSLIPIGIENSKLVSITRKSDERKITRPREKYSSEDKNRDSPNAEEWRPSLKKSSEYSSASGGKKVSNHRVHFELEKSSSKESESASGLKRKIGECEYDDEPGKKIYGSPLRAMDNKLLVRKIRSSLANGMPLKRITIVDPQSVTEKSKFDRAGRSRVEKAILDRSGKSRADSRNLTSRSERTKAISRAAKEPAARTCSRRAPSLSGQIPKLVGSFEKRHPKENKLSYRSRTEHEDKSHSNDRSVRRSSENFKKSVVDLAPIKERVHKEILDRTSRTSGTGDADCAIVLIKAINSSMELSDLI